MLVARLLTGGLLIAALTALVWLDAFLQQRGLPAGVVIGAVAVLVIAPVLAIEVARMLRGAGVMLPSALAVIAAIGGLVATTGVPGYPAPAADTATVAMVLLGAVAFLTAAARRDPRGASGTVGGALLAFLLAGVLPGYWMKIRVDFSAEIFVACVLVVKSADMGAYFGGRLLGRTKLIPWLSPGKTREGLLVGIAASAAVAAAFAWAWTGRPWVPSIGAAAIGGAALGFVGAMGDLAESLLKREAGLKDSGRVLPGMGGLFDVLDSLLPAGPIAWVLLRL